MGGEKRAAFYLRVSTDEQTTDNQRPDLEQIALRRKAWTGSVHSGIADPTWRLSRGAQGRIGPPTRGFSVREEIGGSPEERADLEGPRGRFGAVADPDEAVRAAIKAAVDAGRLELATRLLDVLREALKPGAVVRLETVKRAR